LASSNEHFVVGIGASAGGVEALQELFRHMPRTRAWRFVVVAHLAPGQESALPEIVGRATSLPVRRAEDGAALEGDRVYVAGPDTVLSVEGGRLRVHATALGGRHHERKPVDVFLSSLAEDRGERAIAVILSGTGTDGTLGLAAVKERGGLAVAQGGADGAAPRHNGMPSSAIATGLVDIVVPVELIGAKLADYVRSFGALAVLTGDGDGGDGDGAAGQTADEQRAAGVRRAVHTLLHDQVGHDFSGYKKKTFMRRVQRRMQVLEVTDVDAYVELLGRDPAEVRQLFRDLLIGVTSFFRDPEAFEALEREVVPRLFEGKATGDRLRVWVPACSTGEEAYSIAILLRERAEALRVAPKIQVFATDIDEAALEVARAARYPAAPLGGMEPERLRRFFDFDGGGTYALSKQVRDSCIFSSHSIVRDPPFSRVDLVSCRNLLIYLNADLQARVIPAFHYALRPGGYLFLGGSEAISRHADLFTALDKKHRIYQRRDHGDAPARLQMFLSGPRAGVGGGRGGAAAGPGGGGNGGAAAAAEAAGRRGPAATGQALRRSVEARVLDRFAPAHVVVNREGDVVYYSPRTGKYLEAPAGQPSRQLSLMARRGLRLDLRDALQNAVNTRQVAVRERVALDVGDRVQLVDLTVEPLPSRTPTPCSWSCSRTPARPSVGAGRPRSRRVRGTTGKTAPSRSSGSSASSGTRASGSTPPPRSTRPRSRSSSRRTRNWSR
jgi:two-component system CheB/CheR fusion protein